MNFALLSALKSISTTLSAEFPNTAGLRRQDLPSVGFTEVLSMLRMGKEDF